MRLASLDLNLLLALNALLEERNVTRAGQRLGLTQSSTSALLARLRRHFDDPLLSRVGNTYELTPLAIVLRDRSAAAIDIVERTFAAQATFEAATTDRLFTLVCSDYAIMMIGDALMRAFRSQAPSARLHLQEFFTARRTADLDSVLRTVDGLVLPHGFISGYPGTDLYRDEWAVIAASGNTAVSGQPTLQELADLPWLVTHHRAGEVSAAFRRLTSLGVEPRVDGGVDNFQSLPLLVSGSDRLATVPRRLAERMAAGADIKVLPLPFDVGPIVDALWWHPTYARDPGHIWFRTAVEDACAHVRC